MDKEEVVVIVNKYAGSIKEKLKPQKVILYGSFAKGNWHENSDIDVAVIVDSINSDDILETKKMLFKLRRGIDDRIEPILLEANSSDKSGFLKDVLRHGQVVYSK